MSNPTAEQKVKMKRASYRAAVAWIAANDEAGESMTPEQCGELISAALVADLFGKDPETVGRDIHRERISQGHVNEVRRINEVHR